MGMFTTFFGRKRRPITQADAARGYATHPSISDQLPWLDFSDESNVMLLEDGRSVGMGLLVDSKSCEGLNADGLESLHQKIVGLFGKGISYEDKNPWVMQMFVQDELSLTPLYQSMEHYIDERVGVDDPLAQEYLAQYREHFELMSREQGMFVDPMNGLPYRGKFRRLRILLYRRMTEPDKKSAKRSQVKLLMRQVDEFRNKLQQNKFKVKYLRGKDYYEWFVRWFNPRPESTGGNVEQLLATFPYPETDKPFGWNFTQNIFFNDPNTNDGDGWVFDGLKHRALLFADQQQAIPIGAITMERTVNESHKSEKYAVFDKLPVGSIYTLQVVFESKAHMATHLKMIDKAAVGNDAHINTINQNLSDAEKEIKVKGNMLLRSTEALFIRGKDTDELDDLEAIIKPLIDDVGLRLHKSDHEVFPLDTYLRLLPFNYNPATDKKNTFFSTYKYASDIAKLFPGYGRSKGDGKHPLHIYWNRGGEPFIFDHLNKHFKQSNGHMFIVGTTGSGKSVKLNTTCIALQAVYRPCMFVLEVGGSLDYTVRYCGRYGRDIKQIKYDIHDPIAAKAILSINPFAEGYRALAEIEKVQAHFIADGEDGELATEGNVHTVHEAITKRSQVADDKERSEEADRDILNEMLLAFTTLITQGNLKAQNEMSLDDMTVMTRALIYSLKRAKRLGRPQMIITDLHDGCKELWEKERTDGDLTVAQKYNEYVRRLERYMTDPVRAKCVNRISDPLEEVDLTHIDFGFMQDPSYGDLLNIVCIAFLAKVLAIAEKNKTSDKPTILMLDEAHVFFKSDVVAVFVILMAKVGRKIGLWLIPTTQNIHDFSGVESRKVLSMMETWLCLSVSTTEIELINAFKPLSKTEVAMIEDIRKYPGVYSEGVLLGKNYKGLFRNVPPRLHLALSMTEQDERAERAKLQREHNVDELAASELMATKMKQHVVVNKKEDTFL